jgi:two-component system phosphate regulon response regulator PhoB
LPQADRKTILVVEDEEYLRGLMRLAMERASYQVLEAPDGEEALVSIADRRPDLVLLDVDLPGIDGFAVCERLKADPATRDIRVLMVTAMSEDANRERGMRAGADGYIAKPFAPFALLARIKSELGDE